MANIAPGKYLLTQLQGIFRTQVRKCGHRRPLNVLLKQVKKMGQPLFRHQTKF